MIHWERRPDPNDTGGVGKYVRGIALEIKAISDSPDFGRNQSVIAMASLSHFVEQMARVVEKYPPCLTADMFFLIVSGSFITGRASLCRNFGRAFDSGDQSFRFLFDVRRIVSLE
ncbi:hypothetical protein AVEN_44781-1 [Araneus ventricosus]|uniref:Uncharacterized protein n=1 Tax=Araneus ventricosus TaxID=182803 RepID=A0A4Y2T4P2_ARAVE|nr:hypothetical protein AVEN_44781-1 [Araneus ventricosus]